MTKNCYSVLLVLLPSVLLAACAASPPTTQVSIAHISTSATVCSEDAPTGSHMRKSVCRTPEQIKHDQEMAQKIRDHGSNRVAARGGD